VEALVDQQSVETDMTKRRALVWEIDQRLQEDVARPIIMLVAAFLQRLVPEELLHGHALQGGFDHASSLPQKHASPAEPEWDWWVRRTSLIPPQSFPGS
jgi:hypothetical protein